MASLRLITVFFELLCGPVAMKESPPFSVSAIDVQPVEVAPVEGFASSAGAVATARSRLRWRGQKLPPRYDFRTAAGVKRAARARRVSGAAAAAAEDP